MIFDALKHKRQLHVLSLSEIYFPFLGIYFTNIFEKAQGRGPNATVYSTPPILYVVVFQQASGLQICYW